MHQQYHLRLGIMTSVFKENFQANCIIGDVIIFLFPEKNFGKTNSTNN